MEPLVFFSALAVIALIIGGTVVMVMSFYRKVDQGQALIINKMKAEPTVTFTGGVVYPIVHRAETMDISVKTIQIERRGNDGLICQDNIRADIKVAFFVRVNKTTDDVLKVAQAIGCARASDQETLEELFVAKFSEALKTVGKRLEFEQLYTQRDIFKDDIIDVIGRDLNGYALEDAAIDYLEQTPIKLLDKDNILDSQGIRKITMMTTGQNVLTNDLRQTERKELARQNLEADEAILELEKRKADATARQQREIANIRAREQAEIDRVAAEEGRKGEMARIAATEEIELGEVNKARQVEVAQKDKERVLAIKTEQVEKDRETEVIAREREVALKRIDKDKALEVERKNIAEVVRARIAVDKNVAEEEERILTLRATAKADREKTVTLTNAEAEAGERLVKELKIAEGVERVAEYKAKETMTLANADLEASEKRALAKIRMAEGVQAEEAASGLAKAKVQEAQAAANEKLGVAEARVTREQMLAEAEGNEKKGMADARVKSAHADVHEREGTVDATVTRAKGEAVASAVRERLLAEAAGKEADAVAYEKQALAEAHGVREKANAEAAGIAAKFDAMQKMEGTAREHEEFRLQLEQERAIKLANFSSRVSISEAQSRILAEAFDNADIKIIGGESDFLRQFSGAAMLGESVDSFVESSSTAQSIAAGVASGKLGSGTLSNAAVAAVLARLMQSAEGPLREKLAGLIDTAETDTKS